MPMSVIFNAIDPDALLTEAQAAEFLNLSMRTLQVWRVKGFGPLFVRCGRAVRYRRRDLLKWTEANTAASVTEADAREMVR
jgi:hypothetical protein